jgi:CBS domain-containing protein
MELVKDFMMKSFVSLDPETTVAAACELMVEKKASSILIKEVIEYVGGGDLHCNGST